METGGRDSTQEWLLSPSQAPPTVAELEERIDEAVRVARASEAAAVTVGAAAIESAEEAHRAADLAAAAAEAANAASEASMSAAALAPGPALEGPVPISALEDERLVIFRRRADRVGARFAEIQRR